MQAAPGTAQQLDPQAAIEQRRRDVASKITLSDDSAQGSPKWGTPGRDDGLCDIQDAKPDIGRAA